MIHGKIDTYNNGKCRCEACRSTFSRTWIERSLSYSTGVPETCESCGDSTKLFWDHSHITEKHRGWLCRNCNSVIGYFREDPDLLERAARYLEKFN